MTGFMKDAIRQLATKRFKAAFSSLLKVEKARMVEAVIREINAEAVSLRTSLFRNYPPERLEIAELFAALNNSAPTLASFLQAAAGKKKNAIPGIVFAAAILLNRRNRRINALQRLVGTLLHQGKARVQVSEILVMTKLYLF